MLESRFDSFLAEQKQLNQYRTLLSIEGIDFLSNDYLSFSSNSTLKQNILHSYESTVSLGSTGSRLLSGHDEFFNHVESQLASFSNQPSALFFPTGYLANIALLSSIISSNDLVFSDQENHASIIDGLRLTKADKVIFNHLDISDLENKIQSIELNTYQCKFLVIESIYSMSGDISPINDYLRLAESYDLYLIIDEAHGTGIYSSSGYTKKLYPKGHRRIISTIHTAGKALGVSGAWIATTELCRDFLINKSRPFIYSTAPAFFQWISVYESVIYWLLNGELIATELLEKANFFHTALSQFCPFIFSGKGTPITVIYFENNELVLDCENYLRAQGCFVRSIRYPTVTKPCLRIVLHANHTKSHCELLLEKLEKYFKKNSDTIE